MAQKSKAKSAAKKSVPTKPKTKDKPKDVKAKKQPVKNAKNNVAKHSTTKMVASKTKPSLPKTATKPTAKASTEKQITKAMAKPATKTVAKISPPVAKIAKVASSSSKAAPEIKKGIEVKSSIKVLAKSGKDKGGKDKKSKDKDFFDEENVEGETKKTNSDDDEFFEEKGSSGSFKFGERLKKDADADEKVTQKILNLSDYFNWKDIEDKILSMELFLPKDDACLMRGCENIRTTGPYCRLHYINNWKLMHRKKEILKDGKLQLLVEDLVSKFPPNCIQSAIDDMSDDREFNRVLTELHISDAEFEIEEAEVSVEEGDDDLEFEARSIDTFKPGFEEE